MRRLLLTLLAAVSMLALYAGLLRRRFLTWGATEQEIAAPLLGDDIVQGAHFVATRAVTIAAPPAEIWRWIVQIGSKRAGWYSYDWIDNGGVPSTRAILPLFQTIAEEQFVPFTPDQKHGMWVKEYRPDEAILWWDKRGQATWLWQLTPLDTQTTRLVTRLRTRYDFSLPWILYYALYDAGDIVMMRKCMRGIKERAEAGQQERHHAVVAAA